MGALQTVAMGLVVVFLDAGSGGLDWVADPVGWILVLLGLSPLKEHLAGHQGLTVTAWICFVVSVLIWPPSSVAHLDESLGWLFSVPTIAFCFLLADAVMDVTSGGLRSWLSLLRGLFVLVGVLPVLLYGAGWERLEVPAAVLAVVANVALVLALWQAGGDADADEGDATFANEEPRRSGDDEPEFRKRLRKRGLSSD